MQPELIADYQCKTGEGPHALRLAFDEPAPEAATRAIELFDLVVRKRLAAADRFDGLGQKQVVFRFGGDGPQRHVFRRENDLGACSAQPCYPLCRV